MCKTRSCRGGCRRRNDSQQGQGWLSRELAPPQIPMHELRTWALLPELSWRATVCTDALLTALAVHKQPDWSHEALTMTVDTTSSVTIPRMTARVKVPSIHSTFIRWAVSWLISPMTVTPAEVAAPSAWGQEGGYAKIQLTG